MKRIAALLMLTLWCALFMWLAGEGWHRVWVEYHAGVFWLAAVMAFVSLAASTVLWRLLKLWKDVACSNISPRLANRVIRNILADGIFFFKTGWKG